MVSGQEKCISIYLMFLQESLCLSGTDSRAAAPTSNDSLDSSGMVTCYINDVVF